MPEVSDTTAIPPSPVVAAAIAALRHPGLVVLTGAPGAGRTTALRQIAGAFRGPVLSGGGLAMLRTTPAFALTRAVRVRLPCHDVALLAEAVRSRVRAGLLILDDLQWADPLTVGALPALAKHCRIAVTLRLPHRLPQEAAAGLRSAATAWLPIPPLTPKAAITLARQAAPGASPAALAAVAARSGGLPLTVISLARDLGRSGGSAGAPPAERTLAHAVASALADLPRPARTACAALGLLGRPADAGLLGDGVGDVLAAGLAEATGTLITPVSPYTCEVAAGLLDPAERQVMHRRLADLVPPSEAARHLAAAGANAEAYQVAIAAADQASTGERAELLLLACDLPGVPPQAPVRLAAAEAALASGRPGASLRVLAGLAGGPAAVLRAEAHLQRGAAEAAAAELAGVRDTGSSDLTAARDRIRLLIPLPGDPRTAHALLSEIIAVHGDPPAHVGLRAAIAAVRAAAREPGWETALAAAAASAGSGGAGLAARWSAWLLVETLAADGRLTQAAQAAQAAAQACAADLAYSWQTRFLAAGLWCQALRGEQIDEVIRRAADLADRTLPTAAWGYALAAASLAEADSGLLAPARARLADARGSWPTSAAALTWVAREAAWLDGQPDSAAAHPPAAAGSPSLLAGLERITARWAAHDTNQVPPDPFVTAGDLDPIRRTLDAWNAPDRFADAACAWRGVVLREEIRCLLASGLLAGDPQAAIPPLLAAERLAEEAGLVVLLGRARRALRRHAVRRDTRGRRAGDDLTDREREILRLVAQGEPTRRIAGRLGIARDTVETHIRSGMRKLGAHTRTEAAALATEVWS